jgi:Phage integrase, N-terminal SAM-like domain
MNEKSSASETASRPKPVLLDELRAVMRRAHYSIHTERSYRDWVKRYVAFHRMEQREDLWPAEPKVEAFLTHLAHDQKTVDEFRSRSEPGANRTSLGEL